MKTAISLLLVLSLGTLGTYAQGVIAEWNFNAGDDGDATTGTLTPAVGSGTALAIGGVSGTFAFGSIRDGADDDSGWNLSGFPPQRQLPRTAGAEFRISTEGYQDVVLKFDFRTSNTAPRLLRVLYTPDGKIWLPVALFISNKGAWWHTELVVDFSAREETDDNPNFAVRLVADVNESTGEYEASEPGSTYSPNGTWRFDLVSLQGWPLGSGPQPPQILAQPRSATVRETEEVVFQVSAVGTPPLGYQWFFNGDEIPGATEATLTLTNVTLSQAGFYQVLVLNAEGEIMSDPAELVVEPISEPIITPIGQLRELVDPVTFRPTDTDTLYTVEGVVTSQTNLTTAPNVLFYMQDDTGGIAVYWRQGAEQFIPQPGDRVRVTARLTHFRGLLELAPTPTQPDTTVVRLSTDNPLPEPVPLQFALKYDPAALDRLEGSYVVAENVTFDTTDPNFPTSGVVELYDSTFETFAMYVDIRTDIGGQPKPRGTATIYGVLGQYDRSEPYSDGYQIIPTRYEDIVSTEKPPTIRFTNRLTNLRRPGDAPVNEFTEQGLAPGESLTTTVVVSDSEGRPLTVQAPSEGLPPTAQWIVGEPDADGVITATFTWTPSAGEAGQLFQARLIASNGVAENELALQLYTLTPVEERIAIAEFYANPTSNTNAPSFNPLRRDPPVEEPWINDEYIELVNLSDQTVDLIGWSLADAVEIRHQFYFSQPLEAHGAFIVYGGPLNGFPPGLEVPAEPASESSSGLALNNNGDTIVLRNAMGGVIDRVVYSGEEVSPNGSLTRFPIIDDAFRPHAEVSSLLVSPGRQPDGRAWSEPPISLPPNLGRLQATRNPTGTVTLFWQADPEVSYRIEAADRLDGPFDVIGQVTGEGTFTDETAAGRPVRFYRLRAF